MRRKDQALETLRTGGFFRRARETHGRGRERFGYRLLDASGRAVSGIDRKTWQELADAGLLYQRHALPAEWVLSEAGRVAAYNAWADRRVRQWAKATAAL